MDFDETWYGWITQVHLQVLLFFGQICPGVDPGRVKIGHKVGLFFQKLLLKTGMLLQQTEWTAMI